MYFIVEQILLNFYSFGLMQAEPINLITLILQIYSFTTQKFTKYPTK